MSQESKFRWTVEKVIALIGASGGLVALLVFLGIGRSSGGGPTPSAPDCFLSGTVFDAKNQALAGTAVGFEGPDGSFSFLAASVANGHYETTCDQVSQAKLKLELSRVEWGGCVIAPDTPKEIARGHFAALNIRAPATTQCTKTVPTSQLTQIMIKQAPVSVPITTVPSRTLNPGLKVP
jgi:hypothetical protein